METLKKTVLVVLLGLGLCEISVGPCPACEWMLTSEERARSIDDRVISCGLSRMFTSNWQFPRSVRGVSKWNSECQPSVTADGRFIYFNAGTQNGPPYDPAHIGDGFNLYRCQWNETEEKWGEPEWLGPNVNSGSYPTISPDGTTLYFCRGNTVWVSTFVADEWTVAVPAPYPINDDAPATNDGPVAISSDGSTMFVASTRSGGYGQKDIWQLSWNGRIQSTVALR